MVAMDDIIRMPQGKLLAFLKYVQHVCRCKISIPVSLEKNGHQCRQRSSDLSMGALLYNSSGPLRFLPAQHPFCFLG